MNAGNSLLCFIAGAVTGAAAAILMAPDSGENTRAKIRQGASDMAGKAKGQISESLDVIEKALGKDDGRRSKSNEHSVFSARRLSEPEDR